MATLREAVDDLLSQERIAVAGVSRSGTAAANGIYKKLKHAGYTVFPVNPNASEIEGDPCFAAVADIPGGVDGVVYIQLVQVERDHLDEVGVALSRLALALPPRGLFALLGLRDHLDAGAALALLDRLSVGLEALLGLLSLGLVPFLAY